MEKENINPIAQLIMLIALLAVAYFGFSNNVETQLYIYKLCIGLGIGIGVSAIVWLITNFHLVKFFIRTHLPWSFYLPIRITIAYLFRIEIDGKYMLIRNNRKVPGFQPVGGVYKYLRRENAEFFDNLGLIPDTKIPRDTVAEDDLRMNLGKRYRLLKFIHWFHKKKNREVDPWREFYEELIKPGILSHGEFPHIQYRHVRQHTEIVYSTHFGITEYKLADIYELQFSTDAQKQEIRDLIETGHENVIFATADEIRNRIQGENIITEHSFKIL